MSEISFRDQPSLPLNKKPIRINGGTSRTFKKTHEYPFRRKKRDMNKRRLHKPHEVSPLWRRSCRLSDGLQI
ncbi:unnamed protein product [Merluccius merluccius]